MATTYSSYTYSCASECWRRPFSLQAYSPIGSEDGDGFIDLGNINNNSNDNRTEADNGGAGTGSAGAAADEAATAAAANSADAAAAAGTVAAGATKAEGNVHVHAACEVATTISPARPIPQPTKPRASGAELAASWDSVGEPTIGDRFVDMIVGEFGWSQAGRRPASPPITDPF